MVNISSSESLIIFDVAAISAMIASSFVIATICRKGIRSVSSKILVYFHVTLILDILTFFPHIYKNPEEICEFIAWLHYYAGLANAVVTFLMVMYYRHLLMQESWTLIPFKKPWRMEKLIVVTSLVTLLPFSTGAYGNEDHIWCDMELETVEDKLWTVFAYYFWVLIFLVAAVAIFTHSLYKVYRVDAQLAFNAGTTIGLYCIMAVTTLPLRIILRIVLGNYALLVISISAWVYFLIFLREKKALALFEAFSQGTNADLDDTEDFSWNIDERRSTSFLGPSSDSRNTNPLNNASSGDIRPVSFRPSSLIGANDSALGHSSSALDISTISNPVHSDGSNEEL